MEKFPQRFGRYEILDLLATGGMARIYRARYAGTADAPNRVVAIKKMLPNFTADKEFVESFVREVGTSLGLCHPNIIQVYDFGQQNDQHFLVMEYVPGRSLWNINVRLAERQLGLDFPLACHITAEVAEALNYSHGYVNPMTGANQPIVHRDVSPHNIMVSFGGQIKLFDFGISLIGKMANRNANGEVMGKPSYMSPEQVRSVEIDGRSDIFSLGIVLWELLTGRRLFGGTDKEAIQKILSLAIPPPSSLNPSVPPELDAIVMKSLERDLGKRYQTGQEFKQDLRAIVLKKAAVDAQYTAKTMAGLFEEECKRDAEQLRALLSQTRLPTEKLLAEPAGRVGDMLELSVSNSTVFVEVESIVSEAEKTMIKQLADKPLPIETFAPKAPGKSDLLVDVPPPAPEKPVSAPRPRLVRPVDPVMEMAQESRSQGGGSRAILLFLMVGVGAYAWHTGVFKKNKPAPEASRAPATIESRPMTAVAEEFAKSDGRITVVSSGGTRAPVESPKVERKLEQMNGVVVVKSPTDDFSVFVDGKDTPVISGKITSLPLNRTLEFKFVRRGFRDQKFELTLQGEVPQEVKLDFVPVGQDKI